jgi:FkbM family methyltransferase
MLLRRLLWTESAWNPKVVAGRALIAVLPEPVLNGFKKHYYAYLLTHMPADWIEGDAAIVPKFVGRGDTVLDIGANLGVFSRFLARLVGPEGRTYAFEPIPQTLSFLRHNMRKLNLSQVEPIPFALSDANRIDKMVIPTYRWGSECWYDARIKMANARPGWREIQVESRTLDSFSLDGISFIKCDANYHELAVLRGGLETIRRCHPAMLIEVNPDPDDPESTAYKTFDLLAGEGYRPYVRQNQTLAERKKGQRLQNYFFLRPEHLSAINRDSTLG